MIVTVTMNPAIDRTLEVERLVRGGLNRIRAAETDVGGKGINVSKTIRELGGRSVAAGFVGGNAGDLIENTLRCLGIETDFVRVEGETRTNTKVIEPDGTLTELNEKGPLIPDEKLQELLEKLESYACEGTLFVLAGSIPEGIPTDVYGTVIRKAHKKGAKVLVDADGELLKAALEAEPDMIKPNRAELAQYLGIDENRSEKELTEGAKKLLKDKRVGFAAVSMGKEGALFLQPDYEARCPGLSVDVRSTVGAGDAMAAAMAYAWEKGMEREEMIRTCMAASAGAVMTVGTKPPSGNLVDTLKEKVVIKSEILGSGWKDFKAILFDMDGTLVDSMWMWTEIDQEYLGSFGLELPDDLQKAIEGMSFTETAKYVKERFQIPDTLEEMMACWIAMACDKYRHQVFYKKGAREFLEECKKLGIRLGVATSNSRELVTNAAEALSFNDYFSCILTACEVKKGKPSPDIYLEVAKRLGVSPENCLVFEDVTAGVKAGKAAGMKVCAVEDAYSANDRNEKLQLADYYIEDFRELL